MTEILKRDTISQLGPKCSILSPRHSPKKSQVKTAWGGEPSHKTRRREPTSITDLGLQQKTRLEAGHDQKKVKKH